MIRYNNRSCQIFFLALKIKRNRSQLPLQDLSNGEVFLASMYVIEQQKEISGGMSHIDRLDVETQEFEGKMSEVLTQKDYEDWISKNLVVRNVDFGLGPGTMDITLHNSNESFEKSGETFFDVLDEQDMGGTIIE